MKTSTKILIFALLLLTPLAARWFWFHRGAYQSPSIATLDASQIQMPVVDYRAYKDDPLPGDGRVVIDMSHGNELEVDDLSPLRERLAARGVSVGLDVYTSTLKTHLRGASALVVMAPTLPFNLDEQHTIQKFVQDGGRLLLAADPTRLIPMEGADLFGPDAIFFATSAVPAVNSLADVFDIGYYKDYLYNLQENKGNYRNVSFTQFQPDSPLTAGLNEVMLSAAHSLRSEGLPLITGDEAVFSSVRKGESGFSPMVLSSNGQVLALGDLTFMTPPNHQLADNNRLLSNIADWLADGSRAWDLMDFPFLFKRPVDLLQTIAPVIDPVLLNNSAALIQSFESAGITLSLVSAANPEHDRLVLGVFDKLDGIDATLKLAGVTVRDARPEEEQPKKTGATGDSLSLDLNAIAPTNTVTSTLPGEIISGTESSGGGIQLPGFDQKPDDEATQSKVIEVGGLGVFQGKGSAVLVLKQDGEGASLYVLAEDIDGLKRILARLASASFTGCITHDAVTICPNLPEAGYD